MIGKTLLALTLAAGISLVGTDTVLANGTLTPAPAIQITDDITVESTRIYLGDLFQGIDPSRDRDIADAPAPGQSLLFNAHLLMRIAEVYKIDWRPSSSRDQVIVRRDAIHLSMQDDVRPLIEDALQSWAAGDRVEVGAATGAGSTGRSGARWTGRSRMPGWGRCSPATLR